MKSRTIASTAALILSTVLVTLILTASPILLAREWRDNTGKFLAEAELFTVNGGNVVLTSRNGDQISVPLAQLSARDRDHIQAVFKGTIKTRLVQQVGLGELTSLAFSPDGRRVVTGDVDGIAALCDVATGKEVRRFRHSGWVYDVAFSPDGRQVLTGSGELEGGNDAARLWDVVTGKELRKFECPDIVESVAFAPDGRWILAGGGDGTVRMWDVMTGRQLRQFEGDDHSVTDIAFSPNRRQVHAVSSTSHGAVAARLWDVATGKELRKIEASTVTAKTWRYSLRKPDNDWQQPTFDDSQWASGLGGFGTTETPGSVVSTEWRTQDIWLRRSVNLTSIPAKPAILMFHDEDVEVFINGRPVVSAQGYITGYRVFLIGDAEQKVLRQGENLLAVHCRQTIGGQFIDAHIIDADQIPKIPKSGAHRVQVFFAFAPDGKLLLSKGNWDHTLRLWDVATGKEVRKLEGQAGGIIGAAFAPDGGQVLVIGDNHTARLWDVATGKEVRKLEGQVSGNATFSPDGRQVLMDRHQGGGVWKSEPGLWDVATGAQVQRFGGQTDYLTSVAVSPNGRQLLAVSGYDILSADVGRVWDGSEFRMLEGSISSVVAFSPDGRQVVTGSMDETARLWDVATGQEVREFSGHDDMVTSVAFSPDGQQVLTASMDETVRLWDVATGQEVREFSGHDDMVTSVAFSPDGQRMVTGSWDKTARLWDVATGNVVRKLKHANTVTSVSFSPDGRWLLTCGYFARSALLWDVATGKMVRSFEEQRYFVTSAAFSPNGQQLLTLASLPDTSIEIRLWDVATGKVVRKFDGEVSGDYDAATTRDELDFQFIAFSPDGRQVITSGGRSARLWDVASGRELCSLISFGGTREREKEKSLSSNDKVAVEFRNDTANAVDLWWINYSGERIKYGTIAPSGTRVLRTIGGHLWSMSLGSFERRYRATAEPKQTCDVSTARPGPEKTGWAVVDPNGRFDTHDLDEVNDLHWVVDDDPLRPIPIEIFMRDYYEPNLLGRIMGNKALPPIRNIANLNRIQPSVQITEIEPDANQPDEVTVSVVVAEQSRQLVRGGKPQNLRSGVFDVRLFRDGQLVGYSPEGPVELDDRGKARLEFPHVKLPRRGGAKEVEFAAYAFNQDRVKSETHRIQHDLPQLPPRKGVAYVICMGVNAFDSPNWDLNFAAADAQFTARSVSQRLAANKDFSEVVTLQLLSTAEERGGNREFSNKTATKQNVRQVFAALAGQPVGEQLKKELPSAARLRKARPEDLVLLSFCTHGHNGDNGQFYLFPADIGKDRDNGQMDASLLARLISTNDLTLWLRDVDAGEMVMIVDACQSAATVEQEGFKPGPMGSRGLGQLAYNKRMRILAASQSDNNALEFDRIQHGLLTYALIQDGLNDQRAAVHGVVTLGGWLNYAKQRVPTLNAELAAGNVRNATGEVARGVRPIAPSGRRKTRRFQQPSLFDFTKGRKHVVLLDSRSPSR